MIELNKSELEAVSGGDGINQPIDGTEVPSGL